MKDINEQIREYQWLVYALLKRFGLTNDPDAESFAYEALYKAILTYNEDANAKLNTYATCVISNALRMHLRGMAKKRQIHAISLQETITDDENVLLIDTIRTTDTTEDIVCAKELSKAVHEIIPRLIAAETPTGQKILRAWYESDFKAKQKEIMVIADTTQAHVSRTISNFKYKLLKELREYL